MSCAATHQLDELLVAHLSLFVALNQSEQHVQFGWVQLQFMVLHQAGEVLHWDETGVLWVQLKEEKGQYSALSMWKRTALLITDV